MQQTVKEVQTKVCTKCKEEKLLTEFACDSKSKDGRRATCTICRGFKDLFGRTFGRLTVLQYVGPNRRKSGKVCGSLWLVVCVCGVHKEVVSTALIRGNTVSCGCHRLEQLHLRNKARENPPYWCSSCKKQLTCTDFPDNRSGYRRYKARICKLCCRKYHLRSTYNITCEQFVYLYSEQGGTCASCDRSISIEACHVDHDHTCCAGHKSCGKCIRGLLCGYCNRGLGQFKDCLVRLISAFLYLVSCNHKLIPQARELLTHALVALDLEEQLGDTQ